MHLAMVSTNGTVWDISLTENSSPSKRYLFKLPQSCTYHGYSDAQGILYFIDGQYGHIRKKLIKYHSSFSKKGHKTVVKNIIIDNDRGEYCSSNYWQTVLQYWEHNWDDQHICSLCYTQSLQFGNYFWLYGSTYIADQLLNSEGGRKLFL